MCSWARMAVIHDWSKALLSVFLKLVASDFRLSTAGLVWQWEHWLRWLEWIRLGLELDVVVVAAVKSFRPAKGRAITSVLSLSLLLLAPHTKSLSFLVLRSTQPLSLFPTVTWVTDPSDTTEPVELATVWFTILTWRLDAATDLGLKVPHSQFILPEGLISEMVVKRAFFIVLS